MKLKRNVKILIGIYMGTCLFAYLLSNNMQKLEVREDFQNKNASIVLRLQ